MSGDAGREYPKGRQLRSRWVAIIAYVSPVFLVIVATDGVSCLGQLNISMGSSIVSPTPLSPESVISMRQFTFGQNVTISSDGHYAAYVWTDPRRIVSEKKMVRGRTGGQFLTTGVQFSASTITI